MHRARCCTQVVLGALVVGLFEVGQGLVDLLGHEVVRGRARGDKRVEPGLLQPEAHGSLAASAEKTRAKMGGHDEAVEHGQALGAGKKGDNDRVVLLAQGLFPRKPVQKGRARDASLSGELALGRRRLAEVIEEGGDLGAFVAVDARVRLRERGRGSSEQGPALWVGAEA